MKLKLTHESIQKDIEGFNERIRTAKQALAALPPLDTVPFAGRRAYKLKKRKLQGEVIHIGGLVRIAQEALDEQTK